MNMKVNHKKTKIDFTQSDEPINEDEQKNLLIRIPLITQKKMKVK